MNCKHPYPDTCCCGARYVPTVLALFKGGQLGGELQTIAREDLKGYRVPVMVSPRAVMSTGTLPYPDTTYRVDTYRFEGRMDGMSYVMEWVDPVPALELRVKELNGKIARAKSALV